MELIGLSDFLRTNFLLMTGGLLLDALLGDPVYSWHPVRLMGRCLAGLEGLFSRLGWWNRLSGFVLFLAMGLGFCGAYWILHSILGHLSPVLKWVLDIYIVWHMLALKDLLLHARRIGEATDRGDLEEARRHAGFLVGRDPDKLDLRACNRCGVESVAESLVDGVVSPLFYLLIAGVPGMLLFKIISTMDSMVGYKNPRYMHFGWFGARADDVLNFLPARLAWLCLIAVSALLPGYSASGCYRVGLRDHAVIPGPNAGWSECAAAGSLQIRIAGPIYKGGNQVNEKWLGEAGHPQGGAGGDIPRMNRLAWVTTWFFFILTGVIISPLLF